MPLITPANIKEYDEIDPHRVEFISETLRAGGLEPDKLIKQEEDEFKKTLNYCGASVENASKTIANVMHYGIAEQARLKAAEMILDLHGVRDREGKVVKQPIFQFFIRESNVEIDNVFAPLRNSVE